MLRREICLLNTQHTNSFVLCVKIATTPIKDYEHTWLKYMKLKTLEVSLNHRKLLKSHFRKEWKNYLLHLQYIHLPHPMFFPLHDNVPLFPFLWVLLFRDQTNQSIKEKLKLISRLFLCLIVWLFVCLFVVLSVSLFVCLTYSATTNIYLAGF